MVASRAARRPNVSRTAGILSTPFAWHMRLASPTINPILATPGTVGQFSLQKIESTSDIEENLGISASVSGGAGLLSGSARFAFAKKAKVQSYSLFMTLVNADYAFRQIDEPVFSPDAVELATDPVAFAARYGNHFVRGIKTGGIFVGWIRIEADSAEERQSIDAQLGGSYGLFSANVAAQKSDAIKNVSSRITCDMYHEGGFEGGLPPVDTPDQLFAACKTWADNIRRLAYTYQVTLASYDIVRGARTPNADDLQHQQDVLAECSRLRSKTLDKINIVEYLLSHPSEFTPRPGAPDLAQLHAGVSLDLDVIARAASYAMRNPMDAMLPETFAREKASDLTGVPAEDRPNYVLTEIEGLPEHIGSHVDIPDFLQLN